jgi:hypothetical protein
MSVAGQLLTAGSSGDSAVTKDIAGDEGAAVLVWGPVTIANTGTDPIPAGSGIYIDDPDYVVNSNGELEPLYVNKVQGVASKFVWTTRPWRHAAFYVIFANLTKKVVRAAKKLFAAGGTPQATYTALRKETEKDSEIGSVCRSPTSQHRCALRRYWLYLLFMLTGYKEKADFDHFTHGWDDAVTQDFTRFWFGARVSGMITNYPQSATNKNALLQSQTEVDNIPDPQLTPNGFVNPETSNLISLVSFYTLPMRFYTEYINMFRRRYFGIALTSMLRGQPGHVLVGAKNF